MSNYPSCFLIYKAVPKKEECKRTRITNQLGVGERRESTKIFKEKCGLK